MRHTWDKAKNAANVRKHGIAFERSVRIFDGPTVEQIDDGYEYGEIRNKAIGLIEGIEILVVYTDEKTDERRIVSARKATREERAEFWRRIGSPDG